MSDELPRLILGVGIGLALGLAHFGGLWVTVGRLTRVRRPGLVLVGSTVVRLAAALSVFYGLLALGWSVLAAGMVGFLLGRRLWIRRGSVPFGRDGEGRPSAEPRHRHSADPRTS